jgi:hypothetical protein
VYGPDRKFGGQILGRGWHTVTIFTPQANSGGQVFLNSLTIQPVPVGFSVEAIGHDRWAKGVKSSYFKKFPGSFSNVGLPASVALTNFAMPVPQSLLPVTPDLSGDMESNFYNCGQAKMTIANTNGEFIEVLFVKVPPSGGWVFQGKIMATNLATPAQPTNITGTVKRRVMQTIHAAGSQGTNQPMEAIRDMSPVSLANFPSTEAGQAVLDVNITWPSTPPNSYWTVEVTYWDLFGSSEASVN